MAGLVPAIHALREAGILVRDMAGKAVIDGSFRLTVGTREDMRRFMQIFARVLDTPRPRR